MNNNGLCDSDEVTGCTDESACNYGSDVTFDDGSCFYATEIMDCNGDCVFGELVGGECFNPAYLLEVEASEPAAAPGTVYRFYVRSNDPTDKMAAVFGNNEKALVISTPDGIFNSFLNSSWNASGVNAALFGFFPDLQDDSYATIGLDGPAALFPGAEDPSLVQDVSLSPTVSGYFQSGGTELSVNTLTGASWYVLNTASNSLPDEDGRWLIAQITTTGSISGQLNYQIFPLGVGADQVQMSIEFGGAGLFASGFQIEAGCTDESACNYDPEANYDDGSCGEDQCGVCGGDGSSCSGCLDSSACNYDSDALFSDGSCDFTSCYGCTDEESCNYDESSTVDDGSCLAFDECGVCGGLGAVFECGCADIPPGECDCSGTMIDALGVCGGTCAADMNNNGLCDSDEVTGCTDESACNYGSDVTFDDGSCFYATEIMDCNGDCVFGELVGGECFNPAYLLEVEASEPAAAPGTVYRFYVRSNDPTDKMAAVFGNNEKALVISTPDGIFNSFLNSSWNASGVNAALFGFFPDLQDDSYATIGLDGPAALFPGAEDPSLVQDVSLSPTVSGYFQSGGTELSVNTLTGASWYVLNTASNSLPDEDGRWLIAQITTTGSISGQLNYQIFPLGVGADQVQMSIEFGGAGLFASGFQIEAGCTDESACNYDPEANYDDGSCGEDQCGVCGGDGSSCSGCLDSSACNYDSDALFSDGSCDFTSCYGCTDEESCNYDESSTVDDGSCLAFDECGVCGGLGAVFECGCADIPPGECDCSGTMIDALGVCGGTCAADMNNNGLCDSDEVTGCTDESACNYGSDVTFDDGSCFYATEIMDCNGDCVFGELVGGECFNPAYLLEVEASEPAAAPGTVYRFYVRSNDPTDKMAAVFGNNEKALVISTPDGIYNNAFNSSWNASGLNPALFSFFPDLQDDSFATIGLDLPAYSYPGAEDPSLVQDASLSPTVSGYFQSGGTELSVNTLTGASWYVLNTASNSLPDEDGRWLIAQITTTGSISGQLNYQIFPLGVGADQIQMSIEFGGAGLFASGFQIEAGCTDESACNYDPEANYDDGSCYFAIPGSCDCLGNVLDYCGICGGDGSSCSPCDAQAQSQAYPLTVEASPAVAAEGFVYRLYVNSQHESDKLSAVFGSDEGPLVIETPLGIFNSSFNSSWNASGVNPLLFTAVPELVDDSYATIGLDGPAALMTGATDPSVAQDPNLETTITEYFTSGGTSLEVGTVVGGSWYVLSTATNALPDDNGRWLIAQITTTGELSGTLNYQVFPLGVGTDQIQVSIDFHGVGTFGGDNSVDCGCTDPEACNYDDGATDDDGTCLQLDECGVCGGGGIPQGDCDCDGNVFDQCFICGGDGTECSGCMEEEACNYDPEVLFSDDSCEYAEEYHDCNGECLNDVDGDGVCDEDEVLGCTDLAACNFSIDATEEDGSCDYCSCEQNSFEGYGLLVESHVVHEEGELSGLTTYRMYVTTPNPTDVFSAMWGDSDTPLLITTSTSFYQHPLGSSLGHNISPLAFEVLPELEYDSWLTVGLDGPAGPNDQAPSPIGDSESGWLSNFEAGGNVVLNDETGGALYVVNDPSDNIVSGDDLRILVGQFTTDGELSGQVNFHMFNMGMATDNVDISIPFTGLGPVGSTSDFVCGCSDLAACNYNATATFDDGSCDFDTCVGCTYPGACNFSAEATEDDGSCDFSCLLTGCTDPNAVNHFPAALSDDGSCLYVGCMDPGGLDYDPTANYPGGCDYPDPCPGDFTGDGVVDINDLLDFFQLWGDVCELTEEEIQANGPGEGAGPGGEDTGNAAWSCGDAVEYQGHAYATVLIDDQCWFAENLQNAYLNTGGELFEIDNEEDWLFNFDNNYAGYCYPLFFDGFGPNFGKLYNIHAILSPHLCPVDWHVSTDADWFSLETHLGMPVEALTTPDRELYEIAHDLKDDELWNGTNDTGFSVVPAGEKKVATMDLPHKATALPF